MRPTRPAALPELRASLQLLALDGCRLRRVLLGLTALTALETLCCCGNQELALQGADLEALASLPRLTYRELDQPVAERQSRRRGYSWHVPSRACS